MIDRREFLTLCTFASAMSLSPLSASSAQTKKRMLILIELKGGNDGLNTVIPYSDPLYYNLRPSLAIDKEKVLKINETIGLHPSLTFLHENIKKNNVAVLQGVGYPNPNLSHFRSIDIWETASHSEQFLAEGWLNPLLNKIGNGEELIKGIVLGENAFGPFRGATNDVLVMNNPKQFLRKKTKLETYKKVEGFDRENLNHILKVENSITHAIEEIRSKSKTVKLPSLTSLPKDKIGGSVKTLMTIIAAGHLVPIYKISISGFDTHTEQANKHQRLCKVLDDTFESLYQGLNHLGVWDRSLIMTYSEFGRRVKENGSRGTDHGTANVQFLMGGKIKGGLYGQTPSLKNLDREGNILYHLDFRAIYASLIEDWFKIKKAKLLTDWRAQAPRFIRNL
jgi:uncharacterized protein (DUF1501 family)